MSKNRPWETPDKPKVSPCRVIRNKDHLMELFEDYKVWVEANPLYEDRVGFYEGEAVHAKVAHMRPMTWQGFAKHIGVSHSTMTIWKTDYLKMHSDLKEAFEHIETEIYVQKFEGAATGLLKENMIRRDLDRTITIGKKIKGLTIQEAADVVIEAATSGEISLSDGDRVLGLLAKKAELCELVELKEQVDELRKQIAGRSVVLPQDAPARNEALKQQMFKVIEGKMTNGN